MKYFRIVTVIFISVAFLLTSCDRKPSSQLLGEKMTADNLPDLITKIKDDKTFAKEDVEMLSGALSRFTATPDSLFNKTIAQIINDQRMFLRESSSAGLLNTAISITHSFRYRGWETKDIEGKPFNIFSFIIQNKGKSDISKVEGIMKFVNVNSEMIRGFRINTAQAIKAGTMSQFNSTFPFDENNKNDVLLKDMLQNNPTQLFVVWEPRNIEFANGKKFSLDIK